MNHQETAKVFGKPTRSLGDSFALSDYKPSKVGGNFGGTKPGKSGGGGGGGSQAGGSEEEPSKADFDRWYNYVRLIEDVEQVISELQAARENLSGTAYTQSQVNEIALLQQQERQVTKLRDAQRKYRTHPTLRCSPCRRTRSHTSDRFSLSDRKTSPSYVF